MFSYEIKRVETQDLNEVINSLAAWVSRDLNLDNVLICENGHVAVSDFGLSLLRDTEEMDSDCEPWLEGAGQPAFPAPEVTSTIVIITDYSGCPIS